VLEVAIDIDSAGSVFVVETVVVVVDAFPVKRVNARLTLSSIRVF